MSDSEAMSDSTTLLDVLITFQGAHGTIRDDLLVSDVSGIVLITLAPNERYHGVVSRVGADVVRVNPIRRSLRHDVPAHTYEFLSHPLYVRTDSIMSVGELPPADCVPITDEVLAEFRAAQEQRSAHLEPVAADANEQGAGATAGEGTTDFPAADGESNESEGGDEPQPILSPESSHDSSDAGDVVDVDSTTSQASDGSEDFEENDASTGEVAFPGPVAVATPSDAREDVDEEQESTPSGSRIEEGDEVEEDPRAMLYAVFTTSDLFVPESLVCAAHWDEFAAKGLSDARARGDVDDEAEYESVEAVDGGECVRCAAERAQAAAPPAPSVPPRPARGGTFDRFNTGR